MERMINVCIFMVCGWIGLLVFSFPAIARDRITIHGSDTMLILNNELAAEYAGKKPTLKFKVLGGGSGRGIAALMEGRTDIAAASRAMKEKEIEAFEKRTGKRPQEIIVALDGIGIYVHNNNPVSSLTLSQLALILTGEIRNWREVSGMNRRIDVYNRDKYSGTRAFMQKHVLKGKPFSNLAREVSTTSMLTSCVSRNQGAISYGGIAYSQGAHIIRLAVQQGEVGVWPSRENVTTRKYPLSRPLYFYVNPDSVDEDLQVFLDWVRSPEGQRVVSFVGYYPAPSVQAHDPEPEKKPQRLVNPHPILLTPENMKRHGFDLAVTLSEKSPAMRPGQVKLILRFDPDGHTIQRIQTLSIRIGEDTVVPLTLDSDLGIQFTLRKALINTSSLCLAEEGAPMNGAVFVVQLSAFCSVN
jgi:phosphate transport system substrate-binding protein